MTSKTEISLNPAWKTRGKSVRQLIKEMQSFDDLNMEVRISVDDGKTFHVISLVGRHHVKGDKPNFVYFCGLTNSEKTDTSRAPEKFVGAKLIDVGLDYQD